MFPCKRCKQKIPTDCRCGYETVGGVLQATDLPDLRVAEGQDRYIGYERIGEAYAGGAESALLTEEARRAAAAILEETDGLLLDLGCGDGVYTLPLLAAGARVVGGDISNEMMRLLREKARKLGVSLANLTLCRMNAYDIPAADESFGGAIANSVLHLNSNPEKIVREIWRVLKPGGVYLCFDDAPGVEAAESRNEGNRRYTTLLGELHGRYFDYLAKRGVGPTRFSWGFDRDAVCAPLFSEKRERTIPMPRGERVEPLSVFCRRLEKKGFSDQAAAPDGVHEEAFEHADRQMRADFGEDYARAEYRAEKRDLRMTVYVKRRALSE